MIGMCANPVADKERIGVVKKALMALGVVAMMAVAVVAVPAHAQSTTNTITVNSDQDNTANDGKCTLREAITAANTDTASGTASGECAAGSGTDTINFAISGNGPHTITLGSTLPDITRGSALTIDGQQNRITLSGNNKYRVLAVDHDARLDLNNLTVADANSGDDGGGIYNYHGTLNVTNSTFSGNRADGSGGGIYNYQATLSVTNSTFSGNYALQGGGIYNSGGTATLGNTIVANSTRGCSCRGSTTDGGHNLSSDATCGFTEASSLSDKDPKIGDLADNGGPTQTHALLVGSPAIDQGKASGLTTDQRGKPRPFDLTNVDNATGGDGSDIGAFELAGSSPTAVADSYTTDEDTPLTVVAPDGVLANDTDPDTGDTLGAVLVSGPSNAASFELEADGSFSYAPEADYHGSDSFTYKANDGTDDSDTATVSITINPVNDAPGFAKGADQTVNEDAGAQSVTGWAKDISAGPSDDSSQRVSFDVTNSNNSLFAASGQPKVSPDGTLTYTPANDAHGSATVSVKATDDGGTANGGVDTSIAKTFTITVSPVNDAPTISVVAGGASQSACLGDTTGRITLKLSDADSNLGDLKPGVATSSDTRLVPKGNVVFGGSGGNRTATISTVPTRAGISTVTITVSDGQASSNTSVTVKTGGSGKNTLGGTSGADLLLGKNGDDTLSGLGRSDVLCGANGKDRLTGGGGSDTFDGGSNTDVATDYDTTEGDSRTNIP